MSQTSLSAKTNGRADKEQIRRLTLAAMLTAVVVVLALLGTAIKIGVFNVNLALVPIVIGAALLGVGYGAWFGFVNALVILISGDAAPFFTISIIGTIITVVAKGVLAGLASGYVYKLVSKKNKYAAVILAALVCPVVNTGVFLLGCLLFFWKTIGEWAAANGSASTFSYAILFLIGLNFPIEIVINIILAPVIARILGFSEEKETALEVYGGVLTVVGIALEIVSLFFLRKAWKGLIPPAAMSRPGLRYFIMTCLSEIILLGGVILGTVGIAGKRIRNKLQKAQNKKKK